jgi:hypothetical protein
MHYHITKSSTNRKLGPIPVVTSSALTCPTSCPLQNKGCYADGGPLAIHWKKITRGERGVSFEEILKEIRSLPPGQLWRWGQAGDLPGRGDELDRDQLIALAKANQGRPVICFTHKRDFPALREAFQLGFTVTLSANSVDEVDELADEGLPVATILPSATGKDVRYTQAGRKVATCPATYLDTTCNRCRVCSRRDRKGVVIGFPAHGVRSGVIDRTLLQGPTNATEEQVPPDYQGAAV